MSSSKKRVARKKRGANLSAMNTTLPENFVDSRDFARIARAIRYIDERYREQPRLEDVASHSGLSEFHFNRLFRRWAGVTPKQYLTAVTGAAARDALSGQASVLDAAYSVGLSGPGRLHDLVVTLEAMTPGEIKAQGAGHVGAFRLQRYAVRTRAVREDGARAVPSRLRGCRRRHGSGRGSAGQCAPRAFRA